MVGWGDDEGGAPSVRTKAELANALRQIDEVERLSREAIASNAFAVSPEMVKHLNAVAMAGLTDAPGEYRLVDKPRPILGSRHQPPPFAEVPSYVASMCGYIDQHPPIRFDASSPHDLVEMAIQRGTHLAAYALWRLNWIHPFEDGNGRTSRALCYLLLCVHTGMVLPGTKSLPERIAAEKRKYYNALSSADAGHQRKRRIRIQQVEQFVGKHFVAQLREFLEQTR